MTEHDVTVTLSGPVAAFGKRGLLEAALDGVMELLLASDVVDPSISESYNDDGESVTIEFSMTIRTDKPEQAVSRTMGAIRAALHGMGAATPGWEDAIRQMRSSVHATSDDVGLIDA